MCELSSNHDVGKIRERSLSDAPQVTQVFEAECETAYDERFLLCNAAVFTHPFGWTSVNVEVNSISPVGSTLSLVGVLRRRCKPNVRSFSPTAIFVNFPSKIQISKCLAGCLIESAANLNHDRDHSDITRSPAIWDRVAWGTSIRPQ